MAYIICFTLKEKNIYANDTLIYWKGVNYCHKMLPSLMLQSSQIFLNMHQDGLHI